MFTIVIPSKTAVNLELAVKSIRAHGENCRIIVVDDGLYMRGLDCEYIKGAKPFVFARNVNRGIEAAGCDCFVMNDDAELVTERGFSRLAAEVKSPMIVSAAILENVGNPQQNPTRPPQSLREVKGGQNIAFVCVFIPWALYGKLGPLDERFTEYGWEDTDYCVRARNAGFPVMVSDVCHVSHKNGSTFRPEGVSNRERFERGKAQFEAKWGRGYA